MTETATAPVADGTGVIKPMKLTDEDVASASFYIGEPGWVLEQKMDGARALVICEWRAALGVYTFEWLSSGGGALKFAAAVQHFDAIGSDISRLLYRAGVTSAILDGELMIEDGQYRLFDLPLAAETRPGGDALLRSAPTLAYADRRRALAQLFVSVIGDMGEEPGTYGSLYLVPVAVTTEEKAALWDRVVSAGVEGAVAKRSDGTYDWGTRAKHQIKLKLTKTADVIVTAAQRRFKADGKTVSHGNAALAVIIDPNEDPQPFENARGKRAAALSLPTAEDPDALITGPKGFEYRPRHMLPVGAASLIGKDLTIDVGDVVEVEYLYWTGEAMVQPRITRKRRAEEKSPAECTPAQFPTYSRAVVR